jgi:hypothetical protein
MDRNKQIGEARRLGTTHGRAGTNPYGDLDDGGSADLMTAFGETGWTTEANHGWRGQLCDAYTTAWEAAAGRTYDPPRPETQADPAQDAVLRAGHTAGVALRDLAAAQAARAFRGAWS